jgi:hypothetical protein
MSTTPDKKLKKLQRKEASSPSGTPKRFSGILSLRGKLIYGSRTYRVNVKTNRGDEI